MAQKLYTMNMSGSIHQAAATINRWGWAEYLLYLNVPHPGAVIAVFRMPREKVHALRLENNVENPYFDDYVGPPDPYASTALPAAASQVPAGWASRTDGHATPEMNAEQARSQAEIDAEVEAILGPEKVETPAPTTTPHVAAALGETIMPPLPVVPETVKPARKATAKRAETAASPPIIEATVVVPDEIVEKDTSAEPTVVPANLAGIPEWAQ